MDCLFCKIASGEIDSAKIYEDNDVVAFLDAFPFSKGHSLVIPKKHFTDIHEIDSEVLKKVAVTFKNVATRIKDVLGADGIRISQSNGTVAGQVVFHIHFHAIPRYENDGLHFDEIGNKRSPKADESELKQLAEKLKFN